MKKVIISLFALAFLASPLFVHAQYGGGSSGSSSPAVPPSLGSSPVTVSEGTKVSSKTVTLKFDVSSAVYMAITENSSFTGASWEAYNPVKLFTLSDGDGLKTIYIKFKSSSAGETATQMLNVTLASTQSSVATPATTVTTPATPATTVTTPATPATTVTTPATVSVKYNFTKSLAVGSSGDDVKNLQQLLKDLGYFTYSSITGYYGSVTSQAVAKFQAANGIDAVGFVGPQTRTALNKVASGSSASASATTGTASQPSSNYTFKNYLSIGSSGEEVKQLQLKLKALGYFTYQTATGYFGSVTQAAVVAFQKAKNLSPFPGYVGPGTRTELNK